MSTPTRLSGKQLIGNPIIAVAHGERIATVQDIEIDTNALKAAAVITAKGTLLNRQVQAIPADRVDVWGQDAVLTTDPDAIVGGVGGP